MGIRENLIKAAIECEVELIRAGWASRDAMKLLTEEERRTARLAALDRIQAEIIDAARSRSADANEAAAEEGDGR